MTPALQRCGLAACLLLCAAGAADAAPYEHGETLTIQGTVSGPDGAPLPGVRVVLEAARRGFALRRLEMVTRYRTQRSTVSGEDGGYALEWRWDDYYNHLELLAAIPRPEPGDGKDGLEVLARVDLSRRILQGSPVVVPLTVPDVAPIERLERFRASLESDDQQRIFSDMGRPDEVKSGLYGGHREVSWWYFRSGRVYRFRDGDLVETGDFDPVRPF